MDDKAMFQVLLKQLAGLDDHAVYPNISPSYPSPKLDLFIQESLKPISKKTGKDAYFQAEVKFLKAPKLNQSIKIHPLNNGLELKQKASSISGLELSKIKLLVKGKNIGDDKLVSDYEYLMAGLVENSVETLPVINVMSSQSISVDVNLAAGGTGDQEAGEGKEAGGSKLHNLIFSAGSNITTDPSNSGQNMAPSKALSDSKDSATTVTSTSTSTATNLSIKLTSILDKGSPAYSEFWDAVGGILDAQFGPDAETVKQAFISSLKQL